jgi:hypothetical protein
MSNDKAFNEIRKKVVGNNAADKKFTALHGDFKEAVKY